MKLDMLFIKFIIVGIINTIFGYGVYAFLLYLGLHYTLCVVLSNILSILFNFKTTGTLVFKNKDNKLILKFICVYVIICLLGIVLLRISELFKFNLYIAGFFITCISALISYTLQKNWVFKNKNEKD